MPVPPSAAATWLRTTSSVVASIVGGVVTPLALAVHGADTTHAAGDAGLIFLGIAALALVVTVPLTVLGTLLAVRVLPRSGTVALLAGSLTLPACLGLPVLWWPLPVGAAAAAGWWASGHLRPLPRLLRTHGEATAAREARRATRAAIAATRAAESR
jgi:hypothetical protein